MPKTPTPERWAIDLSIVLRTILGEDRFPIDVEMLALEYTRQRYPDDPITRVRARDLPGFEGALVKASRDDQGWGIAYSTGITSEGRRNFTIAHELGHYLVHRHQYPDGFRCRQEDLLTWDSEANRVEQEANRFAANLLMPLDDFRAQIDPRHKPSLDDLSGCAIRYGVSLTAAILRWLGYTRRRAILVVSRDGFILWARSSEPAFKSGTYIKTSGRPPIEVPIPSRELFRAAGAGVNTTMKHSPGVWLGEPVEEHGVASDRYDLGFSLLLLPSSGPVAGVDHEWAEDAYDRFRNGFT